MSFNFTANQATQGANYAGRAMNAFQTAVNIDNQQPQQAGTTFWFRWFIRVVAIVTGILAMICGIFGALSVSPFCIIAGVLMIFLGFALIMFEVPICCQFVQYTQPVAQFSEQRPAWQKAVLYSAPPLVPLIICPTSVSIIFGFLCILVNGAIQFMLAVGKKAPLEEMLQRAGVGANARGPPVPEGPPVNVGVGTSGKNYNFTPLP
jgi:ABC-type multidrug transport system fused ATPase/permease subunit